MKKALLPILITVLLILVAVFLWTISGEEDPIRSSFSFAIRGAGYTEEIVPWSENEEDYYVFFPSSAGPGETVLQVRGGAELLLDGRPFTEDFDLSSVRLGTPYELRYTGRGAARTVQLTFLQSAHVAAVYIHTASGSMDRIHRSKEYEEKARTVVVDANGRLEYAQRDIRGDRIKGRGNTTWDAPKKSYNLTLKDESDLLGMAPAKSWVLISNAFDASGLRNKIVYDFAGRIGLRWTPRCEYADVYLNGEYAGLYLLTEKIEVSEARLNLGAGAALFSIETQSTTAKDSHWFATDAGLKIQVRHPGRPGETKLRRLREEMQAVEDALVSGTEDLSEFIDLDSWARKYLLEEIFLNVDAALNSQYCYRDAQGSGKLFAGPAWDYDRALGNDEVLTPDCLYVAADCQVPWADTYWFAAMCRNEAFYRRVVELYEHEFMPMLEEEPERVRALSETLETAVTNDHLRWPGLVAGKRSYEDEVRFIGAFLTERTAFLRRAWVEGVPYRSVELIRPGKRHIFYAVEAGKTVGDVSASPDWAFPESTAWYVDGTDERFDPASPVADNLVLCSAKASVLSAREEPSSLQRVAAALRADDKLLISVASLGGLLALMVALLAADWRRNRTRKSKP